MKFAVLFLATGLSAITSAALTTINPCPSCPTSVSPPPITVTSQHQPVSTCTPHQVCTTDNASKSVCKVEPECTTYLWVSTVIPYLRGLSTTTVTSTDATVTLDHVSTILASLIPQATRAPSWNGTGTAPSNGNTTSHSTKYQTLVLDTWCPYKEIGPLAIPGYPGSGLCKTCAEDENGTRSQVVTVRNCLDGSCSTYTETWVSTKPVPATSTSQASYSSQTYILSSGEYTIPVTATYTPSESEYNPVTQTFSITTSVDRPMTVDITKTIYITFIANPGPTTSSLTTAYPLTTSTFVTSNGVQTIPITTIIIPTVPGFTTPVTIIFSYTITVINAPILVGYTTTVTVTFTSTLPPVTVIGGTTSRSTSAPASVSASSTTSSITGSTTSTSSNNPASSTTSSTGDITTTSSSSTSSSSPSATSDPQPDLSLRTWEYVGCFGSRSGFPSFTLVETSGSMSAALCTDECLASGGIYAGLWLGECYCAPNLDSTAEAPGQCNLPCPGNPAESCGGNTVVVKMLRARQLADNTKLFDVYEYSPPSSTTSDSTSSTTSATTDPSSDPDPEPVKRSLDADMELNEHKGRDIKLRRGGMLRAEKKEKANLRVKRDFGLKKPFGL